MTWLRSHPALSATFSDLLKTKRSQMSYSSLNEIRRLVSNGKKNASSPLWSLISMVRLPPCHFVTRSLGHLAFHFHRTFTSYAKRHIRMPPCDKLLLPVSRPAQCNCEHSRWFFFSSEQITWSCMFVKSVYFYKRLSLSFISIVLKKLITWKEYHKVRLWISPQ